MAKRGPKKMTKQQKLDAAERRRLARLANAPEGTSIEVVDVDPLPKNIASREKRADQLKFLKFYRQHGRIAPAARAAGIDPERVRKWLHSAVFRKEVEEVPEQMLAELEATAHRRAKKKSDGLLMFLLKAGAPDKYGNPNGPRSQIAVQNNITTISQSLTDQVSKLSDDELRTLRNILDKHDFKVPLLEGSTQEAEVVDAHS